MSLTVPIVGGLGNQMFILATGIATARRCGLRLTIPRVGQSDSCFEPRPVYWDTMFASLTTVPNPSISANTPPLLLPELAVPEPLHVSDSSKDYQLGGFFQSARYFDDHRDHVISQLVAPAVREKASKASEGLNPTNHHTIGLHIRRGDYLKMADTFEILDTRTYYVEALEHLCGGLLMRPAAESLKIIVFSEDKEFAEVFAGSLRARYQQLHVSVSTIVEDYVELVAMSQCNDLIMANSSYSWWAAYLHEVPLGRIIAPSRWFVGRTTQSMEHIYCDRWTLI